MKKKLLVFFLTAILAVTTIGLTGCGNDSSGSSDTIKIGTLGPYSGETAMYGTAAKNGIELAANEINDNGGIDGKKIEIISYDTKGDTTEAVSAYNRLVNEDNVVGIVGPVLSGEALAIKDAAKAENEPIVAPTATAAEVTQGADNSFRICFLDEYQGNAAAKYVTDKANGLGKTKAAIIVSKGSAYSEGLAKEFDRVVKENGGQVVATESYASGDTDFSAQLTKIKDSGAEVVYVPDYYNVAGPMLKKAKEMGINATFIGGDGWDSIQKDYAEAAEAEYFTNHYAADNQNEVVQNFLTAYKEKYNETPNSFAALGYDGLNCMANAPQTYLHSPALCRPPSFLHMPKKAHTLLCDLFPYK